MYDTCFSFLMCGVCRTVALLTAHALSRCGFRTFCPVITGNSHYCPAWLRPGLADPVQIATANKTPHPDKETRGRVSRRRAHPAGGGICYVIGVQCCAAGQAPGGVSGFLPMHKRILSRPRFVADHAVRRRNCTDSVFRSGWGGSTLYQNTNSMLIIHQNRRSVNRNRPSPVRFVKYGKTAWNRPASFGNFYARSACFVCFACTPSATGIPPQLTGKTTEDPRGSHRRWCPE